MYRLREAGRPMVAPAVEGIDLFKIAGRSISGWIPSFKLGAASPVKQPFCSQLEERLLMWLEYHPQVKSYARGDIAPRTQKMAHRLIHSLRQSLAPGCLPLFTSDGLNLYFYALTAHFGDWLTERCQGRRVRQWQVAAGLIYGQVKKSY